MEVTLQEEPLNIEDIVHTIQETDIEVYVFKQLRFAMAIMNSSDFESIFRDRVETVKQQLISKGYKIC